MQQAGAAGSSEAAARQHMWLRFPTIFVIYLEKSAASAAAFDSVFAAASASA